MSKTPLVLYAECVPAELRIVRCFRATYRGSIDACFHERFSENTKDRHTWVSKISYHSYTCIKLNEALPGIRNDTTLEWKAPCFIIRILSSWRDEQCEVVHRSCFQHLCATLDRSLARIPLWGGMYWRTKTLPFACYIDPLEEDPFPVSLCWTLFGRKEGAVRTPP